MTDHITPCELCGGPVILKATPTGTRFRIPVADTVLNQMMDHPEVDQFIRERLQRAERIIIELREEKEVLRKHLNGS